MTRTLLTATALLGLMAGCDASEQADSDAVRTPSTTATTDTVPAEPSPTITTDGPTNTAPAEPLPTIPPTTTDEGEVMNSTIIRFSAGDTHVDVTIAQDNPTARDFLSMLPLNLTLEEFAGREKIGYTPRPLETDGSPGHDPEDGDLIYFTPWGNIGFYYNTEDIGYDDRVIHLGTYDATLDQLTALEGLDVTIEVVQ